MHINQNYAENTSISEQSSINNNKLILEKQSVADISNQIDQIDQNVKKLTEKGKAISSNNLAISHKKQRELLSKQRDEHNKIISQLNENNIKLTSETRKLEQELGPLLYITNLVYGDNASKEQLERTVQILIIIIVLTFDPTAVVLLLAANHGIRQKKYLTRLHEKNILTIGPDIFGD